MRRLVPLAALFLLVPTGFSSAAELRSPDGRIVVYSCTQAMYFSMGVLAQHLNLPTNRVVELGAKVQI